MGEENISNAFEYFNPSPSGAKVGDCVIRALCKALNRSWEDVYVELCVQGFIMHDLPNSDPIWGAYLLSQGFKRFIIPDTCPYCYTVADFAKDHPKGIYILGTGSHAVAIQDGVIYDNSEARARSYGMGRSFENNGGRSNDGMSYDRMSYDSNRNRDSMGRYSRDAFYG